MVIKFEFIKNQDQNWTNQESCSYTWSINPTPFISIDLFLIITMKSLNMKSKNESLFQLGPTYHAKL
jgi:hypothetical protein